MRCSTIFRVRKLSLACAMMILVVAGAAEGAEIYLTKSQPLASSGQPANSWETAGYWSDGLPASAGNDYYVGRTGSGRDIPPNMTAGRWTCRTPNNTDAIFPGNSLTIDTSGSLTFKGGGTKNYTFNDLRVTGNGQLAQGTDNTTATIIGTVTFSENAFVVATGANTRSYVFNAKVQGADVLTLTMDGNARKTVVFNNDADSFSGKIVQFNGNVEIRSSKAIRTVHQLSIVSSGKLATTVNVDARDTTLSLATGAQLALTNKVQFGKVLLDGKPLATGRYTSADLQTSYSTYFTNGGGTLYVGVGGAFDVLQTKTMPAGTGNDWNNPTYWNDAQGAHAGADYYVGRDRNGALTPAGSGEVICRTPTSGSEVTFPGDSLIIGSNSQLRLKAANGAVINVADLTLTSGTVDNGNDSSSFTLRGHLLVKGNSRFRVYDNNNRQLIIESQMEGDASANILLWANTIGVKSVVLANNNNTYAGSITCTTGTLILGARSALGQASRVSVSGVGKLQTIVPVTSAPNTTLTLSGGGKLDLQGVVGFGYVVIGGKKLAMGKYKASALLTSYSANIINNGGELQVGYDPSPVRHSWLFD